MNIGSWGKSSLAVGLLWAVAGPAFAISCTYLDGNRPAVGAMPLQVSAITIGRDVPVGTQVYRQTFKMAEFRAVYLKCGYAPFPVFNEMMLETSFELADWSSGIYANKVYKTSIPGLGVAINSQGGVLPRRTASTQADCNAARFCFISFESSSDFELILIKLGEVTPGVLTGGSLPVVSMYGNMGDARMLVFKMGISGSLQIVSRTCSTPDVTVAMGTHLPKKFAGTNSATDWVDFSILLNNCPAFHGTVRQPAASWVSQGGTSPSGIGGSGTRQVNSLQFSIDPARTAINPDSGVLSLDPGAAGRAPSASGIGVQIATKAGTPIPLGTKRGSGLILSPFDRSYAIPLRARYLQTSSEVTPGPANASATFTISYE